MQFVANQAKFSIKQEVEIGKENQSFRGLHCSSLCLPLLLVQLYIYLYIYIRQSDIFGIKILNKF